MGCHALLQGIFPTQGSNQGLLHCRQILYHLSHQGTYWEVILTCLCTHVANTPSKTQGILSTPAGSLCPFWVVTTILTSSSKACVFELEQEFSSKTVPITGAIAGSLPCLSWRPPSPSHMTILLQRFLESSSEPNIHPQIFISVWLMGTRLRQATCPHGPMVG